MDSVFIVMQSFEDNQECYVQAFGSEDRAKVYVDQMNRGKTHMDVEYYYFEDSVL